MGDRPVIFVYRVPRLRVAAWAQVVSGVRASGPQPLLVGDATRSVWLPSFDGQFDYASNRFALGDIAAYQMDRGFACAVTACSATRARAGSGPRPSARDMTTARLPPPTARIPRVSERQNGAYYDTQWRSALQAGADWVVVTSWNEWWENTRRIEPSVKYGDFYAQRTKDWAARFRAVTVR